MNSITMTSILACSAVNPATTCMNTRANTRANRRGMSIVEMLTVIGVIALLLAILLPALNVARRNALWGTSQANMKQIGQLLTLYAGENRDAIVPTAFDYRLNLGPGNAPGKVRSASPAGVAPPIGALNYGSWTDILWTHGEFGPLVYSSAVDPDLFWDYRFDSPDAALYASAWEDKNIFRSAEPLAHAKGGTGATPFGDGASVDEDGTPGYFGGNPFFDARPVATGTPNSGKFWTMGQIRRPEASMYIADSNVGELLGLSAQVLDPNNLTLDLVGVEYRYSGDITLMLFLDGHVDGFTQWENLLELEKELGVRVLDLDKNRFFPTQ